MQGAAFEGDCLFFVRRVLPAWPAGTGCLWWAGSGVETLVLL